MKQKIFCKIHEIQKHFGFPMRYWGITQLSVFLVTDWSCIVSCWNTWQMNRGFKLLPRYALRWVIYFFSSYLNINISSFCLSQQFTKILLKSNFSMKELFFYLQILGGIVDNVIALDNNSSALLKDALAILSCKVGMKPQEDAILI